MSKAQDDEQPNAGHQPESLPRKRRWLRWVLALPLLLMLVSVIQVGALRFVDPPSSAFMLARQISAWTHGEGDFRLNYEWRDRGRISSNLPLAVIASEDQRFADHHGFDLEAIRKARETHEDGGRLRGASTISQQTAKNLFLWSGRSWVRKGLEAWYTALVELMWPKARIIEVYVNVAEFGDGVYGAQAAAQKYFGKDASQLSAAESARLAAVLPSPKRYSADRPGPYVQRRTGQIQRQMRQIGGQSYLDQFE
ncbi:monofunctional biosynthetic peptidoglycan transglycosylase [Lysobacter sp. A03]|uniref:monofunctional biosynthetic peptidoglycan transglycosylase n=1 Tax=Lysobacter sp. A03 TaxID=1199154 RepID=UPI0005C4B690|nr:monofunctional biosynthetic peptidoglycan transglycosylase [Lysobacter sp. A03]